MNESIVLETFTQYFKERDWCQWKCITCGSILYNKRKYLNESICPVCHQTIMGVSYNRKQFKCDTHVLLAEHIEKYLLNTENIPRVQSLPIWGTRINEVFVGSGLEYMDAFRYSSQQYPALPVVIFQPSIRLHGGVRKNVDLCTLPNSRFLLAFINCSILRYAYKPRDFASTFDTLISMFSSIGIHASRISLRATNQVKFYGDGSSRIMKVWFYIDNLEVGDHLMLFNADRDFALLETGFGLERLTALKTKTSLYDVIKADYTDNRVFTNIIHFLTLLSMSNIPFTYEPAWSKARTAAHVIINDVGKFDSFLLFNRMYNYWFSFVCRPTDRLTSYLQISKTILRKGG